MKSVLKSAGVCVSGKGSTSPAAAWPAQPLREPASPHWQDEERGRGQGQEGSGLQEPGPESLASELTSLGLSFLI